MPYDVRVINELVQKESAFAERLIGAVGRVVVGQKPMIERILIGLLTGGHVLLEGVPGLAKTLTVKTVADCFHLRFHRIQFTPDLLPADIVGTTIYRPQTQEFASKKGPIFANLVLADEINRAPAKVQSALLEAMQERQVTIGDETHRLPEPFLVMATQNPIEQEGTYALPEAQLDRFMLMIKVGYPTRVEERAIMDAMSLGAPPAVEPDPWVSKTSWLVATWVGWAFGLYVSLVASLVLQSRSRLTWALECPGPTTRSSMSSRRASMFCSIASWVLYWSVALLGSMPVAPSRWRSWPWVSSSTTCDGFIPATAPVTRLTMAWAWALVSSRPGFSATITAADGSFC